MKGWLIGCAKCHMIYDAQKPRCPCGEPTVLNRLALDREKPRAAIPARGWLWGSGIAIAMWLAFAYAVVVWTDGRL